MEEEARVADQVAAPEPARLRKEPEEPLEPRVLHPGGRLRLRARQEVEGRADADEHAGERVAMRGHPALLLRAAEPDEEDARARLEDRLAQGGVLGGVELAVGRAPREGDAQAREAAPELGLESAEHPPRSAVEADRHAARLGARAEDREQERPVDARG